MLNLSMNAATIENLVDKMAGQKTKLTTIREKDKHFGDGQLQARVRKVMDDVLIGSC